MPMLSVSRRQSQPMLGHSARLLAMAGPSESVLMVKVRSLHLLLFAQENSRSSEGLTVSMCCRKNGRLSAVMGPAAARYLTQKTLSLIFTSVLANAWN
jgi:hypothetical protein